MIVALPIRYTRVSGPDFDRVLRVYIFLYKELDIKKLKVEGNNSLVRDNAFVVYTKL